jgi:hypothetical protein
VEVDPGGPLGRAGFRSGDIPFDRHGLSEFCGAIRAAEDGFGPEVWVVDAQNYDYARRRSVRLPAMPRAGLP